MDRKTVLKDSKEQLVVDSVKCCGHVQEDESTYATLVNAIDEITYVHICLSFIQEKL